MMTLAELQSARAHMVSEILRTVSDPAGWLLAVRGICERVGVDPARAIPLGGLSLALVCAEVVGEVSRQGIGLRRLGEAVGFPPEVLR